MKKKRRRRNRKKYVKVSMIVVLLVAIMIAVTSLLLNNISRKSKNKDLAFLMTRGRGQYSVASIQAKRDMFEQSLDIKEIDYKWSEEFTESNTPKEIVVHHTDTTKESPEEVNAAHKAQGWNGIGYHFYIRKDGTIYRGRPEEVIGSHTYGRNRDTIGICLEGNFEKETPTKEQMKSLVNISADMIIKYNLEDIKKHSDLNSTLCPGKNFPMDSYLKEVEDKLISMYDE